MPVSRNLEEEVVRKLGVAGTVRSRRMFGGVGIYLDDTFCGIIGADSGLLYLKVDESNLPDYEARGMDPFRTPKGTMSYYTVPEHVLDDPELLRVWARKAQAIATNSKRSERRRRG